jgi:hypothetical protein
VDYTFLHLLKQAIFFFLAQNEDQCNLFNFIFVTRTMYRRFQFFGRTSNGKDETVSIFWEVKYNENDRTITIFWETCNENDETVSFFWEEINTHNTEKYMFNNNMH